jgi:hypothetical protein
MRLVHDSGAEAALPEMSGAPPPRVNDAGIAAMHRRQRPAQPIGVRRHQDQMDVVRHQAPRPHLDVGRPAMLAEQIAVERVVGIAKERALGDVMGVSGNDK